METKISAEQEADFESRRKIVDEQIKQILQDNQISIGVYPAFKELEGSNGACIAIGIIKYIDIKKYDESITPDVVTPIPDVTPTTSA